MKKKLLLALLAFMSNGAFAQQEGPPEPPPCPPMQNVQFCFTNSTNFVNCEKTICMTFTPKPSKAAVLAGCFYDPSAYCITLAPGAQGCINIPSPGLPITDWYDLTVNVRSNNSAQVAAFQLEPNFLNSQGTIGVPGSALKQGDCLNNGSSGDTYMTTTDGYNYIIENWISGGTGG